MRLFSKARAYLPLLVSLFVGVVIGGYLFSDTQPRSFLALHKCRDTCLQPKELIGLLASVGIQKFPALVPSVIAETERTIVVKHPAPEARVHYLIFPKRDIKNIADVSESDGEYVVDAFRVVREVVKERGLVRYRVVTNGPGYQGVAYLHFHLIAQ
jgi:histidine triad (HIT) family protein